MSKNNFTQKGKLKFIEEQPIRISVFGEFSSGKTTFINGLIGEAILSVAVDPTTAVPTYIRFAREFNILVHLNNEKRLKLFEEDPPFYARFVGRQSVLNTLKKQESQIRDFLKEWTKEGERADEVKNIIIELPLPWLKNNIELVDTPGTNAGIDSHKQHTQKVLADTDLAIFIMDARQGGGKKTEFNFMNKIQKAVSRSFVVVNKMDLLDEDDDEREDILDFITNEAIPNHWKGIIQPEVFGISSLVRLDKKKANNEPELLQEFDRLISVVENIATKERGKILLNRLGNPERTLFEQATKFESEKRFDKAHKIYSDLFDILQTAEMDTAPAQNGIERCEEILKTQVNELDKINKNINEAFALEKKEPDKAIKELRKAQKRLKEMNASDADVDNAVKRIAKRIRIRNKARKAIDGIKKSALTEENKGNLIQAVEIIYDFPDHTDLAELHKNTYQELVELEKVLIKNRDNQCLEKWESNRQKADLYFEKHQYNKARSVIPDIEKIQPFLSNELQKQAKHLLNTIKTQYNQWEDFKKLFRTLRTNILQQFESTAVNSKEIINILPDLKVLRDHCLHFFPKTNKISKLTLHRDTILTINDKVHFVKYLLNYKGNFDGKILEKLNETLLEREEELAAIPDDPKAWFDNPSYFEKYSDHPKAVIFVKSLTIDKSSSFQEIYQLLKGLNAIKPYLNTEIKNVVYEKEIELTELLIKKRFYVLKTKKSIFITLMDKNLFIPAVYVAKQLNDLKFIKIVIDKQIEAKLYKDAIIVAKEIGDNYYNSKILITIAEKQAKNGNEVGAKESFKIAYLLTKNIKDYRDLCAIGILFSESGRKDYAFKVFKKAVLLCQNSITKLLYVARIKSTVKIKYDEQINRVRSLAKTKNLLNTVSKMLRIAHLQEQFDIDKNIRKTLNITYKLFRKSNDYEVKTNSLVKKIWYMQSEMGFYEDALKSASDLYGLETEFYHYERNIDTIFHMVVNKLQEKEEIRELCKRILRMQFKVGHSLLVTKLAQYISDKEIIKKNKSKSPRSHEHKPKCYAYMATVMYQMGEESLSRKTFDVAFKKTNELGYGSSLSGMLGSALIKSSNRRYIRKKMRQCG